MKKRAPILLLLVLGCGPVPPKPRPLPTRQAFREAVLNKTQPELLKLLRRPRTTNDQDGHWTYWDASYDPISRRVDPFVTIWFRPGDDGAPRCNRLEF
jgi:hypothetical protein